MELRQRIKLGPPMGKKRGGFWLLGKIT
uniref:Uncharacterized protein n=1 Tax=Rhizophora mucronata TaxID=61149 RepID=A0A2P2NWQ9_RHIMU